VISCVLSLMRQTIMEFFPDFAKRPISNFCGGLRVFCRGFMSFQDDSSGHMTLHTLRFDLRSAFD
ncbi:MAG: hypothetical protein FWC50_13935, partial [Planctomycetaceae bacterium]|nr:hypothetical protein [Planctomycetaceae bacterium]